MYGGIENTLGVWRDREHSWCGGIRNTLGVYGGVENTLGVWRDRYGGIGNTLGLNISGPADKKIKWGSKLLVHNWQLTLISYKNVSFMHQ